MRLSRAPLTTPHLGAAPPPELELGGGGGGAAPHMGSGVCCYVYTQHSHIPPPAAPSGLVAPSSGRGGGEDRAV